MSNCNINYTDYTIIIPSHGAYKDVCDVFLYLLKKNWPDCPFRIVLAIHTKPAKFDGYTTLFCEDTNSLMGCLAKTIEKYPSPYYFVFLPDALISRPIIKKEIDEFLSQLKQLKPAYCRLMPTRVNTHPKKASNWLRYIHTRDRYVHSFIAFLASKQFLLNEIKSCPSDLSFEVKYLQLANDKSVYYHFKDRFVLTKDIFHIVHGIVKGKWDRVALYQLRKDGLNIKRARLSWAQSLYHYGYIRFMPLVPNKIRLGTKQLISKIRKKDFVTKE